MSNRFCMIGLTTATHNNTFPNKSVKQPRKEARPVKVGKSRSGLLDKMKTPKTNLQESWKVKVQMYVSVANFLCGWLKSFLIKYMKRGSEQNWYYTWIWRYLHIWENSHLMHNACSILLRGQVPYQVEGTPSPSDSNPMSESSSSSSVWHNPKVEWMNEVFTAKEYKVEPDLTTQVQYSFYQGTPGFLRSHPWGPSSH